MKFALIALAAGMIHGCHAYASVRGFNSSGAQLGRFTEVQCGNSLTCTQSSGRFRLDISTLGNFVHTQTASTSGQNLTTAACGTTVVSAGAHTVNLFDAALAIGCRITLIVGNASNFTVNPVDADQILILTNAVGDAIQASAVGQTITLHAISASEWAPGGYIAAAWSDVN